MRFYAGHLLHDNILGADRICRSISAPCENPRCPYTKNFPHELQGGNLTSSGEERDFSKGGRKACDCFHSVIKVKGKNLIIRSCRTSQMRLNTKNATCIP